MNYNNFIESKALHCRGRHSVTKDKQQCEKGRTAASRLRRENKQMSAIMRKGMFVIGIKMDLHESK